jgi:hypothetical protein
MISVWLSSGRNEKLGRDEATPTRQRYRIRFIITQRLGRLSGLAAFLPSSCFRVRLTTR